MIERRKGLPVALGVIWLHAARAAGWGAHGVDFPAHFMIALQGKSTQMVLDVFHGGVAMSARDLARLLKRIEGEKAELRPGLLLPMNVKLPFQVCALLLLRVRLLPVLLSMFPAVMTNVEVPSAVALFRLTCPLVRV